MVAPPGTYWVYTSSNVSLWRATYVAMMYEFSLGSHEPRMIGKAETSEGRGPLVSLSEKEDRSGSYSHGEQDPTSLALVRPSASVASSTGRLLNDHDRLLDDHL